MIPPLALSFYGDDFTGSTDVMEVLTWAGLPTVLFLQQPSDEQLARFPNARAIGIAGLSRSKSPQWMDDNLPAVFRSLRSLNAPVCHYKVCSTFDSSPEIGSIGRAMEIGQDIFDTEWVPIVVGAPALNRFQVFGNLFARVDCETYRLDRHPTMMRHPVTPMNEADLRVHLARQTSRPVALLDFLALTGGETEQHLLSILERKPRAVLFDILDEHTLAAAGRIIWNHARRRPIFSASSSGLEYALVAYWRSLGELPQQAGREDPGPVDRLIVVSGSCSPETERSIRWAISHGFEGIRLDVARVAAGETESARKQVVKEALRVLVAGRSVVVYSALGPGDLYAADAAPGLRQLLGQELGGILRELLEGSGVRRAVVAGGDTSGYASRELGIYALQAIAPMTPGSPLCRASADSQLDGLQIVLKGGQRGGERFFEDVRLGRTPVS